MGKWERWYEAQPEHVKRWFDQPRAIWYDSDMWKAFATGVIVGCLVGLIL